MEVEAAVQQTAAARRRCFAAAAAADGGGALPPAPRPLLTGLCLAVCLAGLAQVVANVTFGELARRLEKEGVVVLAFYAGEGCVAERAVDGWVGM